jgi:hypothetical protein
VNELIKLVVQNTGINQSEAQKAVEVIIDFLKNKLPAPIAAQVDTVLGGANAVEVEADDFGYAIALAKTGTLWKP